VFVSDEDENKQPRRHWLIPEKESRLAAGIDQPTKPTRDLRMQRTNTTTGAKFTVRGQVYIQTGHFYHTMGDAREVRVLELRTSCPECSQPFEVTASLRQISTRQLVRRCPRCRKIYFGPVVMPEAVAPKRSRRVSKTKPHRPAVSASAAPSAHVAPQAAVPESYLERLATLS
jgi:hypothetical protein